MNSQYFVSSGNNCLTSYPSIQPSVVHGISQTYYQCHLSPAEDAILYTEPQDSPRSLCSGSFQAVKGPAFVSQEQFCTLESSSCMIGQSIKSSSAHSFSSTGSPVSQQDSQTYPPDMHYSPENTYCSTMSHGHLADGESDLSCRLREIEKLMLGPDPDCGDNFVGSLQNHVTFGPGAWRQMLEIRSGGVKQVLIACAKAIAENNLTVADWFMSELNQMVSVSGTPIERVSAYMLEGLKAKLVSSGSSIYKSLKCKEPTSADLLTYMHKLYEVCPYFKFGYLSANGAIADALKGEDRVHIIDFQIAQGSQWISLIQALAARPGGPPHVRITGIDDAVSAYARGGGLQLVGQRLSYIAKSCNVPFEFNGAGISGCDVEVDMLKLQPHEALAVNFPFQLHHMPDESVSTANHRDRLLRLVKGLSPKVVTLVEQECNANTAPFFPRFMEALSYYTAMFESIDVTMPRDDKNRISVEQHCLAGEIVNIIACEGAERVERHELFDKWRSRFMMAGFKPYPLSSLVNSTIKDLLQSYCKHYSLEEREGALFLGWKNRPLIASCAWC
ncbi:scarecrow-like protein 21 isoform X1 [Nymphaea colorata]|uniref:Uncharacterized protein n=1 Tax=Nymphaea colorata TaxID=210225 RepID=A0A5K1FCL9_9MAGN|nr:scarecrow-like protein 21 isoform X1 [Nymphaea colorata]VVW60374.1 unnamed protein product [Nymphaea colorata]